MKLVILGAHTAAGQSLAEVLGERGIEAEVVRATTTEHLDPQSVLVDADTLDGAQGIFLTFEGELAQTLAAGASRLTAPVVDVVGAAPRATPLIFPQLERDLRGRLAGAGLIRVPLGLVSAVVSAGRALRPFGVTAVRVVTFESAARAGQPGLDELAAQSRGIFTHQEVAPTVFPAPVAFGVVTTVGELDDPFGPDRAFAEDVAAGLGDVEVRVTRTQVPVFTAEGAHVELTLKDTPDEQIVRESLDAARGLRASRQIAPGTLEVVDREDALYGRLRVDGPNVDLWLSADRLHHGAIIQAALVAEVLVERPD